MRKQTSRIIHTLMATTALGVVSSLQAQAQETDFSDIADQIIVRGVNIPDEKRATSEISSILTPEKLERQGDSDIAEALRRVTGLSLSQGKFIVVRGLNERYSNLTLNGSPLPSPEPLRRVAPLDLFPTTVVDTALVQKTFSPEFSGEFGGGLIELRSKGVPKEGFLSLKISGELDTESTARKGLTFDGGTWDWAGFGDSTYNVPPFLAGGITANPGVALRSDTGVLQPFEAQAIGADLNNAETRVIQEGDTPANHSVNLSGGQRFDLDNGMSIGFVSSLGYSRDFQTKVGSQDTPTVEGNGEVRAQNQFDFESQTETVLTNALFSTGIEFNDFHEVNLTGIVLRKSTKEARLRQGFEGSSSLDGLEAIRANTEFFENQVWSVQANSEHVFENLSDLSINLRGAYSEAYREAPYETEYLYVAAPGQFGTVNGVPTRFRSLIGEGSGASSDGFGTSFSQVDDTNLSGGIDVELPVYLGNSVVTFKTGYAYNNSDRDYVLRRFGFANNTGLGAEDDFWYQRIDFLTSDANIGPNGLQFIEFSDQIQPQAYRGELTVNGAYFGVDAEISPVFRAAFGVRYEDGEQLVDNFNIAAIATPIINDPTMPEAQINEDYFLPAVTLTWNPLDDIQLRAAFSQTITRPQFQELGDAFFTDTDRDIQVIGNPFLENIEANNYDIRAEYYFGREQYITFGGFYKELTNPIEESLVNTGDDVNTTFINAPSAELYGFEVEYEQRFNGADLFSGNRFFETKDIVISTNYTWSQSSVGTDGDVIVNVPNGSFQSGAGDLFFRDGRALQGQSDHIVNAQIGYEDYEAQSKMFLLFNWNSKRIRQVGLRQGGNDVPDTVERLPMSLDFVYSRNFEKWGGMWQLSGKVGNILNDDYDATADGANGTFVEVDVYDVGTTFSLGLKRDF